MISEKLNEHFRNNSMFDPLQSGYRDKHFTETAFIKIQNDILSALDAGSSPILLMLDLSAAVDTIDHDILLSRLCDVYNITGNVLNWFRSYLTGRIQRVIIEDSVSVDQELNFGVPQGSVLSPRIYCMYTKPVSDIIQRHGLSHHSPRALMELHWLPVDKRIEYTLLLYTYKALHGLASGYLCELVVPFAPRRVLRSAESNLLTVPPGKPGKYGSKSFVRASANLWISPRGERAAWLKNSPTVWF